MTEEQEADLQQGPQAGGPNVSLAVPMEMAQTS